jgi:hypothetical protein
MRDPAYRAEKQERSRERAEKAKRERIASLCKKDSIRSTAYVMARDFVTDRLKAPSTAEFPYGSGYSVSFVGECSFVVTGYVDSQNGFGAMIRTPWVVKLTRDLQQTDYWKLDDIAFVQ